MARDVSRHDTGGFGVRVPTSAGAGLGGNMGAPSLILQQGRDEEARGITPSPFTVPYWKMAAFLIVMLVAGAAVLGTMERSGMLRTESLQQSMAEFAR